jgi:putative transcriptional regulator
MITCQLKQIAEAKEINRHQLSMQTGVSYPTIDKYWNDKADSYERRILDKLCELLDCEPGDLIVRQR